MSISAAGITSRSQLIPQTLIFVQRDLRTQWANPAQKAPSMAMADRRKAELSGRKSDIYTGGREKKFRKIDVCKKFAKFFWGARSAPPAYQRYQPAARFSSSKYELLRKANPRQGLRRRDLDEAEIRTRSRADRSMYSAPRSHQKSRALTRAARRAQRVQDRPRRRRRSGRSCATERSEGRAKEHRFSRSDRPLWLAPPASSARRSAPSTGCGWEHLPPPPSARARACAAGFSRSAVAPSRFAIRRVVTVRIQIITLSHHQSACTLVGLVLSPASGGSRENRIWMQRLVSSPPARARALRRRLPSARHCL